MPRYTDNKHLPPGFWLRLCNLPPQTTEQQVADAFSRVGVPITVERVTLRQFDNGYAGALVSIPYESLRVLVQAQFQGKSLNGKQIEVLCMPNTGETKGRKQS